MTTTHKIHNIHDFLALLKGVKPAGKNQWLALCPGHDDHEQRYLASKGLSIPKRCPQCRQRRRDTLVPEGGGL